MFITLKTILRTCRAHTQTQTQNTHTNIREECSECKRQMCCDIFPNPNTIDESRNSDKSYTF